MRVEPEHVEAVWQKLYDWGCLTDVGRMALTLEDLKQEFDIVLPDPQKNELPGFRKGDPDTSRRGALDAFPRTGTQRAAALMAIAHSRGLTYYEVQQATGISGIWKRISELKEGGWIEVIGQRFIPETGSEADVYRITDAALRNAKLSVNESRLS